ncbi:MAG: hypothetical protein A3G34_08630 [Candidatus Lindowbacteria bacterium RIFCSPLOWO2_12_FULL_62_27]|nr:MAG: hypothetical protein A3G34_08630 [Candidatus Lindowbacteria bacterium RIFCSPLOWO2_12_FULL_62_27]OGH62959.1 MAG: hypothetical protein A3I06_13880 [Candidatus Lindowbacteria bacterium RIFCSPLOWO2_02_FULL_62_12]
MKIFNYRKVAREARIPASKLDKLRQSIRAEFPTDDMMYELHLLRACMAIKDGYVSVDEALKSEPAVKA